MLNESVADLRDSLGIERVGVLLDWRVEALWWHAGSRCVTHVDDYQFEIFVDRD